MSRLETAEQLLAVLMTAQDQIKSLALRHFPQEKLHHFLKDLHQHNISTQQQILHDLLERESRQSKNVLIEYKNYAASRSSSHFEGTFPEVKKSSVERRTPKTQLRRPATVPSEVDKTTALVTEQPKQEPLTAEPLIAAPDSQPASLPMEEEHNIPAPLEITDIQISFTDEPLPPEHDLPLPQTTVAAEEEPPQEQLSIAQLTDRLDEHPEDGDLWCKRADKWLQKGDLIAAISDYLRATELQKQNPKPWLELSNIYAQKGLGTKAAQAKQQYQLLDAVD